MLMRTLQDKAVRAAQRCVSLWASAGGKRFFAGGGTALRVNAGLAAREARLGVGESLCEARGDFTPEPPLGPVPQPKPPSPNNSEPAVRNAKRTKG